MKTKLPWMVVAAAFLAACDEKQEPAAVQSKLSSSTKRFTPDRPVPAPKPPAPAPIDPPVAQESPPPAPPAAPATPPPAATALSAAEREAQRAEQRQQRIARVTEQIATRLKGQDANHDGFLTQNELTGPMQRGFTRADTNNDGSLDATEQQAMVQNIAERMGNSDRGGRNDRRGFNRRGQGGFGGGFGGRRRDD